MNSSTLLTNRLIFRPILLKFSLHCNYTNFLLILQMSIWSPYAFVCPPGQTRPVCRGRGWCLGFWDKVHSVSGCPRRHYVAQAGLKGNSPASTSYVLELHDKLSYLTSAEVFPQTYSHKIQFLCVIVYGDIIIILFVLPSLLIHCTGWFISSLPFCVSELCWFSGWGLSNANNANEETEEATLYLGQLLFWSWLQCNLGERTHYYFVSQNLSLSVSDAWTIKFYCNSHVHLGNYLCTLTRELIPVIGSLVPTEIVKCANWIYFFIKFLPGWPCPL